MAKTFFKIFFVCLVVFTLVLIPVMKIVSEVQIFESIDGVDGSIEEEMSVLVDPESEFFSAFKDANRVNMLVVGINDKLSDTIMLVSWDMDYDRVDVISVPRDTYYERKGYTGLGDKKINAAYASEGIVGTANAVSDVLMGIPINYYAVVDYEAVENIVDGVGGIPIDVPQNMKYDDPSDDPPLHIDIKAGEQTLDGEHAVQYLRFRKGYKNGDIGRVAAQQEFMKSLFKQCLKNGILDSAKLITKNVKSDITVGAISKYVLKAAGLKSDSITTYTMPGEGKYIDELSYYVQDEEATKEMLTEIYQINTEDSDTDVEGDESGEYSTAESSSSKNNSSSVKSSSSSEGKAKSGVVSLR